jgi:hypothetical protein
MAERGLARGGRSWIGWLSLLGLGVAALSYWTCSKEHVVEGRAAQAPTGGAATGPTATPRGVPVVEIDLRKLQRAAIAGTVRDDKDRPIAGAQVCASADSPLLETRELFTPTCVSSGRDGHYRIEGLWPVRHTVSASAPGHVPAFHARGDRPSAFDRVDLTPGGEALGVDIVLRGGGVEIRGVVQDLSGGAVEGAIVSAGGLFQGTGMAFTTSGPDGEFSLWVAPGTPQVFARAEGYAPGSDRGAAPGHAFELYLTPEAVLVGKVVRAGDGSPVEGARVTAHRGDAMFGGGNTAITDASGQFRISQLSPGAYKPGVEGDDVFGMGAEQVVLGLGETSAPIVIEAHAATTVEGAVVVSPGGGSCRRGEVTLRPAAGEREPRGEIEADGRVRVRGVLPGTYAVKVRCEGFVAAESYAPVVVEDKPLAGLRWEVAPGQAIRGVVVTAKGEPAPGVRVAPRIKAEPGKAPPRGSGPAMADTDARGRFELTGLVPGDYELRGGSNQPLEVTLPEGQDLDGVRIELPATGELRGEVRDVHGNPVARAQVSLQAPGQRSSAMTAADGSFHAGELTPGEYRVSASRDGVKLRAPGTGDDDVQGEKVTVTADAVATVKLVVETGNGRIVGVVREEGGGVVSDAFVEVTRESESAAGRGAGCSR